MANSGLDNEYYLGSLNGKGELLKQNYKVRILSFGYNKVNKLNFIRSCFNSIKFSREIKADYIYICGFKACTIIRIFSIFFTTPKIIHAIRWNPISNNKDDRIFRVLERFFTYQTYGWICNSRSAKNTLISYCGVPKNRTFCIYNGIEVSKYKKYQAQKKNIVLTLSNFALRKGIVEYLNVIEIVIKKNKILNSLLLEEMI